MIETYNLNPLAKEWVEALLSGKYEQGKNALRPNGGDKFCCLGVAADLINPSGWNTPTNTSGEAGNSLWSASGINEHSELLPAQIWNQLMMDATRPISQQDVADANDGGATFADIVHNYILPAFAGPTLEEDVNTAY